MSGAKKADEMIVVGQFSGPHGVAGQFKVRSFTERPKAVGEYGVLTTSTGLQLTIKILRELKPGLFVATAPEIASREACDAYNAALLTVSRRRLPDVDGDEFYHADLVGMNATTPQGAMAGKVVAVVNFGAGDILELAGVPDRKGVVMVPFTRADVPSVDVRLNSIVVVLPDLDVPALDDGA